MSRPEHDLKLGPCPSPSEPLSDWVTGDPVGEDPDGTAAPRDPFEKGERPGPRGVEKLPRLWKCRVSYP